MRIRWFRIFQNRDDALIRFFHADRQRQLSSVLTFQDHEDRNRCVGFVVREGQFWQVSRLARCLPPRKSVK